MENQEQKEVFMPCKRGSDKFTNGQHCDSKVAFKMQIQNPHSPTFKCVKCGYVWSVGVGGSVNI
jgi:hypothetical protein